MKNCSNSSVYCFGEVSWCDHLRRVITMTIMTILMKDKKTAMPPIIATATTATGSVDSPPPPPACMEKIDEFN